MTIRSGTEYQSRLDMDISSGTLSFGVTCPEELIKEMLSKQRPAIKQLTSFDTSFATREIHYQCPLFTKDPSLLASFISSIDALESLSIQNYERNVDVLWPAILQHASSLKSLAIHTPPQLEGYVKVWTRNAVSELAERMTGLKKLEMDVSLAGAEERLKQPAEEAPSSSHDGKGKKDKKNKVSTAASAARGSVIAAYEAAFSSSSSPQPQIPLPDLPRLLTLLNNLTHLTLNINLTDRSSSFASRHTWNVMGSINFPDPNKEHCAKLARLIWSDFLSIDPDNCKLEELTLRFPRRCWDDRCQFSTVVHVLKARRVAGAEGMEVEVEHEGNWKEEGPKYPTEGVLRELINEYYRSKLSI